MKFSYDFVITNNFEHNKVFNKQYEYSNRTVTEPMNQIVR